MIVEIYESSANLGKKYVLILPYIEITQSSSVISSLSFSNIHPSNNAKMSTG